MDLFLAWWPSQSHFCIFHSQVACNVHLESIQYCLHSTILSILGKFSIFFLKKYLNIPKLWYGKTPLIQANWGEGDLNL